MPVIDFNYILSQFFIVLSYFIFALTYYVKTRKGILLFNTLSIFSIGTGFWILGAYTGMAMGSISLTRNFALVLYEKKMGIATYTRKSEWALLAFLYLLTGIVAYFSFTSLFSLLAVFPTALYTFSIFQKSTKVYRFLGIFVSGSWVLYNIYVLSLFGIILESILVLYIIYSFVSLLKSEKVVEE